MSGICYGRRKRVKAPAKASPLQSRSPPGREPRRARLGAQSSARDEPAETRAVRAGSARPRRDGAPQDAATAARAPRPPPERRGAAGASRSPPEPWRPVSPTPRCQPATGRRATRPAERLRIGARRPRFGGSVRAAGGASSREHGEASARRARWRAWAVCAQAEIVRLPNLREARGIHSGGAAQIRGREPSTVSRPTTASVAPARATHPLDARASPPAPAPVEAPSTRQAATRGILHLGTDRWGMPCANTGHGVRSRYIHRDERPMRGHRSRVFSWCDVRAGKLKV